MKILPASIAATVLLIAVGFADPTTRPTHEVTLTRRSAPEYGTSAYSFRYESQDRAVNKKYVDLVYGNCGSLHVNMFGGSGNRITDLGEQKLADAPNAAPDDAKWYEHSVIPTAGHVYLEEVNDGDDHQRVKFRIDSAEADMLKQTWANLAGGPFEMARGRGAAGTMGMCGRGVRPHDPS